MIRLAIVCALIALAVWALSRRPRRVAQSLYPIRWPSGVSWADREGYAEVTWA